MSNTIIQAPPMTALPPGLARLPRSQQLKLGIGLIAVLATLAIAWSMFRQPDWRVLFSNLSDKDGGAIVAQLSQMNIPYRHGDGGGAILVPSDKVHEVRLRLAAQGLPRGSVAGFELTENARFGMTQFQERLNFQRGLEGELTRSIQALSSVQSARVHLALPSQNGFFREQQKPSASVLVTLHPGRTLDRSQVAGIVHLVASSVPELNPKSISVIDEAGNLLSGQADAQGGADIQQLQYTRNVEQMLSRRVVDLLETVVGRSNVRAQVTADIDFSQVESTIEQHKPNQAADAAAIRSQQVVESNGQGGSGPAGVPGAASNQPPGTASAPINGPAAGTGAGAAAGQPAAGLQRRESVTNYEVDKTVRVVHSAPGTVKRVNAAVVVNHITSTDAAGKVTTKPLTEEQMAKISALVREAIGYSKDRGDSINVMNTAFVTEVRTTVELPWWQQQQTHELARALAWPAGLFAMALVFTLGLVRPAIKAMNRPQPPAAQAALSTVLADAPDRPALLEPEALPAPAPTPQELRLEDARQIARANPVAVANIVKTWVSGEPAA